MEVPLRVGFHRALDEIDRKVLELFQLVGENLRRATEALLAAEPTAGRETAARDALVDSLYADVEELAERNMLLEAPVAGEFKYLLSIVRIVPELERSGDLAEHIAQRAARGVGSGLSPALRGIIEQMGAVAEEMWWKSADAYADRDPAAATSIDELDDRLDALRDRLSDELAKGTVELAIALDMNLVGRFYERLGDHALHLAERIRYFAPGS